MKQRILFSFSVIMVGLFILLINPVQSQEKGGAQDQQPIHGKQMMTQEEREQFREKMRAAKTNEEKERIRKEHHEQMKARAMERGVNLPDEPPARGSGMNRDGGMGPGGGGRGGH